ncbi:MAG: ATP synthase F1 subunit epsilon [Bacteroides sp.]|nr:ATP synthase F1 subunit epsilon [Bacteroides sp.]MDE6039189.1 ATP synthase F1 subunit epsilon [Paramuribaculum sp.]MBD5296915.1 ATP synthase F1 subunit epsilon [Bacteroides sp.]MBD5319400.1 ATP synthase F1 subunit epsilon [Bacteroides sp.]MBD5351011.1 ATP synthase F1 subunit epsilon [Bacteroides sp.]
MTLKIISAEDILFEGEVTSVSLPGTNGRFTVLKNHASLISTLEEGNIVFTTSGGEEQERHVLGGLVDVDNNIVSVCIY